MARDWLALKVQAHSIATGHIMLSGAVDFTTHCRLELRDSGLDFRTEPELHVIEEEDVLTETVTKVQCLECGQRFTRG